MPAFFALTVCSTADCERRPQGCVVGGQVAKHEGETENSRQVAFRDMTPWNRGVVAAGRRRHVEQTAVQPLNNGSSRRKK